MALTKDQILASLPALSKDELAAIKTVADSLLGQAVGALPAAGNAIEGMLCGAVTSALGAAYGLKTVKTLPNQMLHWQRHAPGAVEFIESSFKRSLEHRVTTMAMLSFLIELLISDLKRKNIPVSFKTITLNLSILPQIFERQFPNYLASGAGDIIIASMQRSRK